MSNWIRLRLTLVFKCNDYLVKDNNTWKCDVFISQHLQTYHHFCHLPLKFQIIFFTVQEVRKTFYCARVNPTPTTHVFNDNKKVLVALPATHQLCIVRTKMCSDDNLNKGTRALLDCFLPRWNIQMHMHVNSKLNCNWILSQKANLPE